MIWLTPEEVARRLGISRKSARTLMGQMEHTVILGKERTRIRVSETALDAWMMKRARGTPARSDRPAGSQRRLERR